VIAVVGGTGMAGSETVRSLCAAGQDVVVLSRNTPEALPTGAGHVKFDLTSDDPASVLADVDVLVDLANSSTRPERVILDGTSRLLDACAEVGVGHYVGISIVGCESVGIGYYRAKVRQEELIRQSPVPWSLLWATQFHELLDGLMARTAALRLLPGGSSKFQPVAASEVGSRLAGIARGPALNASDQIAGPEVATLGELSRTWRAARRRRCAIAPLPLIGGTGRALKSGALTAPGAATGGPGFGAWLEARYGSSGE